MGRGRGARKPGEGKKAEVGVRPEEGEEGRGIKGDEGSRRMEGGDWVSVLLDLREGEPGKCTCRA